jgi:hypothetical protein
MPDKGAQRRQEKETDQERKKDLHMVWAKLEEDRPDHDETQTKTRKEARSDFRPEPSALEKQDATRIESVWTILGEEDGREAQTNDHSGPRPSASLGPHLQTPYDVIAIQSNLSVDSRPCSGADKIGVGFMSIWTDLNIKFTSEMGREKLSRLQDQGTGGSKTDPCRCHTVLTE